MGARSRVPGMLMSDGTMILWCVAFSVAAWLLVGVILRAVL